MSRSLSALVLILSEGLHNYKCTDSESFHENLSIKDNQLIFKCSECNKNHYKDFNNDLIKNFSNIYKFCDGDIS